MNKKYFLFLLIYIFSFYLGAQEQSGEPVFLRRISWQIDENVFRYSVEVEKADNGIFIKYLHEYTSSPFLILTLPEGEYRYRIIPYDILDRPRQGTQWMSFEVTPPVMVKTLEKTEKTEKLNTKYNTLGVSIGSSFIDPLAVATIHGSFSPLNYLFIQAGADIGFLSAFKEADSYYSIYPFLNIGCFLPLNANIGVFTGLGAGWQYSSYTVSQEKTNISIFAFNATAGVNLWNMINVQYTLKTNFKRFNHLASIGYVYRFGGKK